MLEKYKLFLRTVLRLTPAQVGWRARYVCRRRFVERNGDRIFRKYYSRFGMKAGTLFVHPGFLANRRLFYSGDLEKLLANDFEFLNRRVQFGEKVEWHRPEFARGTRLWKLTINYHEYLVDVARRWRADPSGLWGEWLESHVREWMNQNPLGTKGYGLDNWNSYALSLRIVSWIRVYATAGDLMTADFKSDFLAWLAVQSHFLADNVEWDILGNHIIKNWKALSWASKFFGDEALATRAKMIYAKAIRNQFAADGMHEELSPMYAAIVLEDIRDVRAIGLAFDGLDGIAQKLTQCVGHMCVGDDWARFNDSCRGMAPEPSCFQTLGGRFNSNGYVGGTLGAWWWMADFGAQVLGRQPGHVHCDALSFELARDGEKVFANCGVFEYNPGRRRDYSRSAQAHNTLWVRGHEQHEMWKAFRIGRMGTVMDVKSEERGQEGTWEAKFVSYDGTYSHTRCFSAGNDGMTIADTYESPTCSTATIFFHLGPAFCTNASIGEIEILRRADGSRVAAFRSNAGAVQIEKMPHYLSYGAEVLTETICVDIQAGQTIRSQVMFR